MKNDDWEIGLSKTGYISETGRCLVMQARISDTPVVMVLMMDSNGKYTRIGDANVCASGWKPVPLQDCEQVEK